MDGMITRDFNGPLYSQLVDRIKARIETGELKPNEKLSTESELCKEYDVSRITIRKALDILCEDGLIYKRQGVGAFVSEKKIVRNANRLMGFTETCELEGKTTSTKLLFAGLSVASRSQQRDMALQENDPIICIKRLRYCDSVPIILEYTYFAKSFAGLLCEDLESSLHRILRKNGYIPVSSTKKVSICYATKEEAEQLDVKQNGALLLLKGICYDSNNSVLYLSKSVVNSNRYEIEINNSI